MKLDVVMFLLDVPRMKASGGLPAATLLTESGLGILTEGGQYLIHE